jgi:hypothetical protein
MKKQILLLSILLITFGVSAQVFVENFESATVNGNLEGYNGWYVSLKSGDNYGVSPKIDEFPLFYTNYPGSNIGHVALLDSAVGAVSSTQRISTKKITFAVGDTLKASAPGIKFYSAFMVNVNPVSYRSYRDFFNYEGSATSSMTRGRVFAKNNTAGDEVMFAVTKNSSTGADLDAASSVSLGMTLGTGVNHLLVLKYEVVDGASNDVLTLFINPDPTKTEAEQTNKVVAPDTQTDYSTGAWLGINLRQRGIGAQIGGIRVGRSWEATVMGLSSGISSTGSNHLIYSSENSIVTGVAGKLNVYSLSGSTLISEFTEGNFKTNLQSGLYIVQFTDLQGRMSTAKIKI